MIDPCTRPCKQRAGYSHGRRPRISDSAESPLPVDASQFRRISSSFGLMGSDELGRVIRIEVIIHGKKEAGNFQEEAGNAAT